MRRRSSAQSVVLSLGLFLMLAGWSPIARAQEIFLPQSRQGSRTAPILLLTRTDIQKEIELSAELVTAAKSLASELHRQALPLQGKTGQGVLMARRSIDDQQTIWLNKNLSRPQLDRLHQLDLQWEGPAAFVSRPIIAEYLRLTPEQSQAIARAITDRAKSRQQARKPADSEQAFARQTLSSLSEQQQTLWLALLGKTFDFQNDPPTQDRQTAQVGAQIRQ